MRNSSDRRVSRALLVVSCLIVSSSSPALGGVVTSPSNGGNAFLHTIGWQTFDNAVAANNNSGISDSTPDNNTTFDPTPFGSNSGGNYLTGIIGAGSSILGRHGLGQSTDNGFLNGPNFGSNTVGFAPFGMNIVDVAMADGSAGTRIGPNGGTGASSWKFQTNGSQEFGDFSITNESDFTFKLERIHFDARSDNANAPKDLDLIYLAGGDSNLDRVSTGTEVPDLHEIAAVSFPSAESNTSVYNVSASVAASFASPTAVRLAPGDTASFRFRWTNAMGDFAQSQIDNLAISGTFQDQNNGFASIDPVAVPEPNAFMLVGGVLLVMGIRRKYLTG